MGYCWLGIPWDGLMPPILCLQKYCCNFVFQKDYFRDCKVGITTDLGGRFHPFPTAFVEGRRFISDESQRKDLYDRMQLGKYMCTGVCNTSVFPQIMGETCGNWRGFVFLELYSRKQLNSLLLVPSFQKANDKDCLTSLSCVAVWLHLHKWCSRLTWLLSGIIISTFDFLFPLKKIKSSY